MSKAYLLIWCILGLAACGPSSTDQAQNNKAPDGHQVFKLHCVLCHGADGKLGLNGAKDLTKSSLGFEERKLIITNGKNLMTPFATVLKPSEIEAVAIFTLSLNPQLSK